MSTGQPQRKTKTETITTVRHVVGTFGPARTNPPSLGQLREFVAACEGLDDDIAVRFEQGHLDEGGRYTYTFGLRLVEEA